MHRFKYYLAITGLVFALGACDKASRQEPLDGPASEADANFFVDSIKGGITLGQVDKFEESDIPGSAVINFVACLKDRTTQQPLRNQTLFIGIPGTSNGYNAGTNPDGCLQWSEELPYNYYAGKSGYVILNRDIVGHGIVTGKRRVDLAIDPWTEGNHPRDSGASVVFLRDNMVPPKQVIGGHPSTGNLQGSDPTQAVVSAEDGLAGVGQDSGQLIVQTVDVKASPSQEGKGFVSYNYEVKMEPVIRTLSANGEQFFLPVKGHFNIWTQVLASQVDGPMDRKALILVGQPFSSAPAIDGTLKFEASVSQDLQANQGGLELAVKIVPRDIGHGVTVSPFNGLIRLGTGTQLADGNGGAFVENQCLVDPVHACDFANQIQNASNYQDLVKKGYLNQEQRYTFSNVKVRFFRVRPGETATQRTVEYTASTCILDQVTGKPLINTPLKLHFNRDPAQNTDVERDPDQITTDISGCLNWPGAVFHKYYQQERYYERTVTIDKESGFSQKLSFILNPWDTNVNFGYDVRELGQKKIDEIRNRPPIPSKFFIGDYYYHTRRFLYNIDQFMELEVKKTVLIDIVPQVLRYSAIKDARKMVEHLRDGIYLMKVAIQKKYLDPRDVSGLILKEPDGPDARGERRAQLVDQAGSVISRLSSTDVRVADRTIPGREFITYDVALVRVMDGTIIYPFELTMKDLRLMRSRANLMIELQTADERLVQAYQIFKKNAASGEDLTKKLIDFQQTQLHDGVGLDVSQENLNAELGEVVGSREASNEAAAELSFDQLQDSVKKADDSIQKAMQKLTDSFKDGSAFGTYVTSSGDDTGLRSAVLKDGMIDDNFQLSESMLDELKVKVGLNDFGNVELPLKSDFKSDRGLDIFAENDSGLEQRSFVGPIIFLNNAYSDSVRATDALGNKECAASAPPDPLRQSKEALDLADQEYGLRNKANHDLINSRPNNAYEANPYFGALTDLCGKSVDDLIAISDDPEKGLVARQQDMLTAVALKSTYIKNSPYPLDFVSLTDEPLKVIDPKCQARHLSDCLVDTTDGVVKVADLLAPLNQNLPASTGIIDWMYGKSSTRTDWKMAELPQLFYENSTDSRIGICNLLANRIASEAKARGLHPMTTRKIFDFCRASGGLIKDLKYRVEKAGDYTYLGGLNLNFNVGQSFSVDSSHSMSVGASLSDFIGALAGGAGGIVGSAGLLLEIPALKIGASTGTSTGTSVSASTYLVSQIAKFRVNLTAYERCAIVRLSDQAVGYALSNWTMAAFGALGLAPSSYTYNEMEMTQIFKHGLFVCEGDYRKQHTATMPVDEMYFYFTQHFTEGDMLDQGDLYNQPWLLAMRGFRDYAVFTNRIEAQQVNNFGTFLLGALDWQPKMQKAWALDKLDRLYKEVTPTYPGYYTVLEPGEDIPGFLLQQTPGFTKTNPDPLKEVVHQDLRSPTHEK